MYQALNLNEMFVVQVSGILRCNGSVGDESDLY